MKNANNHELLQDDGILDHEKIRYKRKGFGLFFAILFTLIWFLLVPQMSKHIWPYRIEREGVFFFFSNLIVHEGIFILNHVLMWIIYKLEWSFFENYKTHDVPWPWKENSDKWNKLIKETIILLAFNHIVIIPLLTIKFYITDISPFRIDYESLPTCFEVIWQTVFFMIMDDFTFYWSHRFLHWDKIYPYVHKVHHKYVNTVSIASEYAHPLEYLFGNLLTMGSGPFILGKRVHLFTVFMWNILRCSETTDGHCGYEFSWSPYRLLPMSASSEFHNFHHINFKGNYGSFFTYMDRIFGTINSKYLKFIETKKEYSKKSVSQNMTKKIK